MIEIALSYASRGWPVFPCQQPTAGDKSTGKRPLTVRGFKDASTDPDKIRLWWGRWPNANIGIPTGAASGVVVIDVDGEQGLASLADLELPPTLISRTGGGGLHYIYRPGAHMIGNTQSRLAPSIDTRGEGGYIIAPGSVHWSGAVYEWADADASIADLPDEIAEILGGRPTPPPVTTPAEPDRTLERASAYLATMDPAIQGAGGHSALYAAATAMVHGFDLSRQEALSLLASEYNPRCVPPWDMTNLRDRKEFERKVDQAMTQQHDQPKGWLRDAEQPADADDEAMLASGREFARHLLAQLGVKAEPETQPTVRHGLLMAPGLVGRVAGWINATAYMPQPELALANALAFVGALVGRKVRTPTDLRTNMYCLGVGDSGCGKDHSRKAIKRLIAAAGLTEHLLGGEDVSSDTAILNAVHRQPSILFQFDEIGHFFAAAKSQTAATFTRMIPVTLTKLFSSANTTFLGKEYAGDQARKDIQQPNVCMYGTTVPGRFYQGITPDEIRDGFLGRMLVFSVSNPDPDPQDVAISEVPQALVDEVVAWWGYKPEPPAGTGNLAAVTGIYPAAAQVTAEAQAVFGRFRDRCRQLKAQHRTEQGLDALWARAGEHAAKVALTVSIDSPGAPIIGGDAARYACELVESLVGAFVGQIQDRVGSNEFDRDTLRVARVIREAGEVKLGELVRKSRGIAPRHRKEIVAELVTMGQVAVISSPSARKPITIYRWVGQ